MRQINFELNPTLRCNLACPNCNRHCHLKPKWAEDSDITVEQLKRFVNLLRDCPAIKAKRVKVSGGEPFVHPDFPGLYQVLTGAVDEGLILKIKIDSNGTLPRPKVSFHPAVHWSGRRPSRKRHLPTLWSPTDLGLPIQYPCGVPHVCGISLDDRGFLPCSMAISIVRTFGWWEMYSDTFETEWDMEKMCRHCVFAGPEEWRRVHCKPLSKFIPEELQPTKSWAEAMK